MYEYNINIEYNYYSGGIEECDFQKVVDMIVFINPGMFYSQYESIFLTRKCYILEDIGMRFDSNEFVLIPSRRKGYSNNK